MGTKTKLNSSIKPAFKKEAFRTPPPSRISLSMDNNFFSFSTTTVNLIFLMGEFKHEKPVTHQVLAEQLGTLLERNL